MDNIVWVWGTKSYGSGNKPPVVVGKLSQQTLFNYVTQNREFNCVTQTTNLE